jgi:DNA-directed RNA polymerase subunit RPC12/RpoP
MSSIWMCQRCDLPMALRQRGTIYRCIQCGHTVPVPSHTPKESWFSRCLTRIRNLVGIT